MVSLCSLSRRVFLSRGLSAGAALVGPFGIARGQAAMRVLRVKPAGPEGSGRLGYDAAIPGPTLRFRRGEELRIRLVNELSEPTSLHWHGLRVGSAAGGVPVPPGGSLDYHVTLPHAGTFWYRPQVTSAGQLERGLAGLLIVDETQSVDVDRDVGLIFATRAAAAGQTGTDETRWSVNGLSSLDLPVRTNERLRVRLLNASGSRLVQLHFDPHPVRVMAIDGHPAEPFLARQSTVLLGPGNRIDLFLDATQSASANIPVLLAARGGAVPIARLVYADGPPARAAPLPEPLPLPDNPLPSRIEFRGALNLSLLVDEPAAASAPVTGAPGRDRPPLRLSEPGAAGAAPPLFTVKRGRSVILALLNRTPQAHAFHIHGHHVRLLDRLDDGWKPFWLDTILVAPAETVRVAFVADAPGAWTLEGVRIDHGAALGGWFKVE